MQKHPTNSDDLQDEKQTSTSFDDLLEDDVFPSKKSSVLQLAICLIKDACLSRLEINYKRDLIYVKRYEQFYSKIWVGLFYLLSMVNLSTILIESPSSIYINNRSPPFWIAVLINVICEAYFYYRWYIIFSVSEKGEFRKSLSMKLTISILILMSIDALFYVIVHLIQPSYAIRWSRILRPILLLTFPENRRLRAAFNNLNQTSRDIVPVFGLVLVTSSFTSLICTTLLKRLKLNYPNGNKYFTDFGDALWDIYVLVTTSNSPDVIIPAYEYSRVMILIYVFICVVCNWLFLSILTASVYTSYKAHLGESVLIAVGKRKARLDEAFFLIASPNNDGQLSISKTKFIRLMHKVFPNKSTEALLVLFHMMDVDKTEQLNLTQFGRLSEYVQTRLDEIELSRQHFQTYVPHFYSIYKRPVIQLIKRIAENKYVQLFFTCLVILNGVTLILCRSWPKLQNILELLFTLIFLVEIILNYIACGGVYFFHNRWNTFDCIVVFGALFGQALEMILHSMGINLPSNVTQMLLLLRLFRLLKLFSSIKPFRIVINCVIIIIPSLTAYTTILLILFYIFTCFAMEIYGQLYDAPDHLIYNSTTNCNNLPLAGTEFVQWHYCIFSFNSAAQSFLLLFILTVHNNWQYFTDGYALITTKWTRVFFLIINWSCALIVLNIVLAFIIEAFLIEYNSQQPKFEVYISKQLQELDMDGTIELEKRQIYNFEKYNYVLSEELLDTSFPIGCEPARAFFLKSDRISTDLLMFLMFEQEIEDLIETRKEEAEHNLFKNYEKRSVLIN